MARHSQIVERLVSGRAEYRPDCSPRAATGRFPIWLAFLAALPFVAAPAHGQEGQARPGDKPSAEARFIIYSAAEDAEFESSLLEILRDKDGNPWRCAPAETIAAATESAADVVVLVMPRRDEVPKLDPDTLKALKQRKIVGIGFGAAQVFGKLGLEINAGACAHGIFPQATLTIPGSELLGKPKGADPVPIFDAKAEEVELDVEEHDFFAMFAHPRGKDAAVVDVIARWREQPNYAPIVRQGNCVLICIPVPATVWSKPYAALVRDVCLALHDRDLEPFARAQRKLAEPGAFEFKLAKCQDKVEAFDKTLFFRFDKGTKLTARLEHAGSKSMTLSFIGEGESETYLHRTRVDAKAGEPLEITVEISPTDIEALGDGYWALGVTNFDPDSAADCTLTVTSEPPDGVDPDAAVAAENSDEEPKPQQKPLEEGQPDQDESGPARTARVAEGLNVILAQSDKGDALWGYSNDLGTWTRLAIPVSKKPLVPTLGSAFGFYVSADGHRVYGYSGVTGTWAEQAIPQDRKIVNGPTTSSSVGVVETDDHVYAYSPTTGRWAGQKVATKFSKSMLPPRAALQFTRVVVRDEGKLFIFSDSTGRWSSTGEGEEKEDGSGKSERKALTQIQREGFFPSGPGRGGMGGMGGMGAPQANNARSIRSFNVIIKWNEKHDTFWGYSNVLGRWTKLALDKPAVPGIPTVGSYIAALKAGETLYAYSAKTGRWDGLKTTAQYTVESERVLVEDQGKMSVFSNDSGRWSTTGDGEPQPDESTAAADRQGAPEGLLDASGRGIVITGVDAEGNVEVLTPDRSGRLKAREVLAELKSRYGDLERQAQSAAGEFRELSQRAERNDPKLAEARAQLQALVRETFEFRDRAQRLEAEMLRERLRHVDSRLSERERLKDRIINRRLEELLNPDLKWEPRETRASGTNPGDGPLTDIGDREPGRAPTIASPSPEQSPQIESRAEVAAGDRLLRDDVSWFADGFDPTYAVVGVSADKERRTRSWTLRPLPRVVPTFSFHAAAYVQGSEQPFHTLIDAPGPLSWSIARDAGGTIVRAELDLAAFERRMGDKAGSVREIQIEQYARSDYGSPAAGALAKAHATAAAKSNRLDTGLLDDAVTWKSDGFGSAYHVIDFTWSPETKWVTWTLIPQTKVYPSQDFHAQFYDQEGAPLALDGPLAWSYGRREFGHVIVARLDLARVAARLGADAKKISMVAIERYPTE